MKTALETLIIELRNSQHIPTEECEDIIERATILLKKEKEQIKQAYSKGQYNALSYVTAEQYFNETFAGYEHPLPKLTQNKV